MRNRYYWRTIGYHVWGIFERHPDNLDETVRPESAIDRMIESVGARGRGDAAAREYCREAVAKLNSACAGGCGALLDDDMGPYCPECQSCGIDPKVPASSLTNRAIQG
jgi:hypothetical protein